MMTDYFNSTKNRRKAKGDIAFSILERIISERLDKKELKDFKATFNEILKEKKPSESIMFILKDAIYTYCAKSKKSEEIPKSIYMEFQQNTDKQLDVLIQAAKSQFAGDKSHIDETFKMVLSHILGVDEKTPAKMKSKLEAQAEWLGEFLIARKYIAVKDGMYTWIGE
jgi:hypothetical protein